MSLVFTLGCQGLTSDASVLLKQSGWDFFDSCDAAGAKLDSLRLPICILVSDEGGAAEAQAFCDDAASRAREREGRRKCNRIYIVFLSVNDVILARGKKRDGGATHERGGKREGGAIHGGREKRVPRT